MQRHAGAVSRPRWCDLPAIPIHTTDTSLDITDQRVLVALYEQIKELQLPVEWQGIADQIAVKCTGDDVVAHVEGIIEHRAHESRQAYRMQKSTPAPKTPGSKKRGAPGAGLKNEDDDEDAAPPPPKRKAPEHRAFTVSSFFDHTKTGADMDIDTSQGQTSLPFGQQPPQSAPASFSGSFGAFRQPYSSHPYSIGAYDGQPQQQAGPWPQGYNTNISAFGHNRSTTSIPNDATVDPYDLFSSNHPQPRQNPFSATPNNQHFFSNPQQQDPTTGEVAGNFDNTFLPRMPDTTKQQNKEEYEGFGGADYV